MLGTNRQRTFTHSPFPSIDEFMNLVSRGNCCSVNAPSALAIDIRERKSEYLVEASLPGFRKEEVDVQLHDGVLTIAAHRASTDETGDETWIRRERSVISFERQIKLPEGVTGEGIKADLAEGVLTVRIPKPAQVQPRKISIA